MSSRIPHLNITVKRKGINDRRIVTKRDQELLRCQDIKELEINETCGSLSKGDPIGR
jgi:hypothetical protein